MKTKDYKTLPITDELEQLIRKLILRRWGNDRLVPRNEDWLTATFRKYRKMAGLSDSITFHSLGHTFATWLASANVGFKTIQSLE